MSLTVAFVGTLGCSYAGILLHHPLAVKSWLQVILPAETGLLGSACGFFFGSNSR
jgi:hypothetical protein